MRATRTLLLASGLSLMTGYAVVAAQDAPAEESKPTEPKQQTQDTFGERRVTTRDITITVGDQKLCVAAGTVVTKLPNEKFDVQQKPCKDQKENAAFEDEVTLSADDQARIISRSERAAAPPGGAYKPTAEERNGVIVKGGSQAKRYTLRHAMKIKGEDVPKGGLAIRLKTGKFKFYKEEASGDYVPVGGELGKPVALTEDEIAEVEAGSYSLSIQWGALVVPYKFQLSGDRELRGGATIGPYAGIDIGWDALGIDIVPIAFFGVGNTSVRQNINGVDTDSNLFALSYGGGVTLSIDQQFQIGAVAGFDHVSDDAGYQYNDKPWVALQIGYSFTQ